MTFGFKSPLTTTMGISFVYKKNIQDIFSLSDIGLRYPKKKKNHIFKGKPDRFKIYFLIKETND